MAGQPEIAVVIPTHRRETRLAFGLEALSAQSIPSDRFEVVVVRDSDAAGPFAEPPPGLPIRELRCPRPGSATKRNDGWRASSAPLIAFMDDDCRPSPGWLEGLTRAAQKNGGSSVALILQGRTQPDPDELHLLYGLARSVSIEGPTPFYETCNIAYPRFLLETLDGLDESFGLPPWGEDTDLGLRARDAGARLVYEDDALVWHAVHSRPFVGALREAARRQHTTRILRRHPSYRGLLKYGVFANEAHAGLTCFLGFTAIASRLGRPGRALSVVAALPYLLLGWRHFRASGPVTPRRLARFGLHFPVQLAVDVVEMLATVRGALRDRILII